MITLNIAKFLKRLLDASENHLLNGLGAKPTTLRFDINHAN